MVVATHPAGKKKSRVGVERDGVVYELFFTKLPQGAFTAADVVALNLHRGAFENALGDEDLEQDPDRWCSHAPLGQECWQILSQWVWHLRLELGHQLEPTPMRTTEFAPALAPAKDAPAPASGYARAEVALPFKAGRFSGRDFVMQPNGTLRCPAGQGLSATEERREADGSLRLVYAARISQCRPCPLREQCQWHGRAATKPRRVSVRLASTHRRLGSPPLEGLESADPSPSMHAVTRSPTGADPFGSTRTSSASHECAPAHASRSGPITAIRGQSDWRVIRVRQPRA